MADILIAIAQLEEPARSIGLALDEFYDRMKALEKDPARGGKQATLIVMTMNDIEHIIRTEVEKRLQK